MQGLWADPGRNLKGKPEWRCYVREGVSNGIAVIIQRDACCRSQYLGGLMHLIDSTCTWSKHLVGAEGAVMCMATPESDELMRVDYLNKAGPGPSPDPHQLVRLRGRRDLTLALTRAPMARRTTTIASRSVGSWSPAASSPR